MSNKEFYHFDTHNDFYMAATDQEFWESCLNSVCGRETFLATITKFKLFSPA